MTTSKIKTSTSKGDVYKVTVTAPPKKIGTFPLPPASFKPLEKVFTKPTKSEKQNC